MVLVHAARQRWPRDPLALGPPAMAPTRCSGLESAPTSTRRWAEWGVAAELHQHAAEAGARTSVAGVTGELTPFVIPARVPLNPAGAAPSARFWRTSPTHIPREYTL